MDLKGVKNSYYKEKKKETRRKKVLDTSIEIMSAYYGCANQ